VFFNVTVLTTLVSPSAKLPNATVAGDTVIVADKLELAAMRRRTVVRIQEMVEADEGLRLTTAEARIETPEKVVKVPVIVMGEFAAGRRSVLEGGTTQTWNS